MRELWIYHTIALTFSIILDRVVGDPYSLPHPIRWIGNYIALLEKKMVKKTFGSGLLLAMIVMLTSVVVTGAFMFVSYKVHPVVGITFETILSCYFLAAKSLYDESMKVYKSLKDYDLVGARKNLSMIVGRDTANLDEEKVAKAAVETVAENTSDGVIAPLLYMVVGGPILGALYKSINTMDSMIGYHNEKYEYFGKAAAKIDDAANFLPSRISALFMIVAAGVLKMFTKSYDSGQAFKIWKRDRLAHKSPNSAQTESVAAGALGLALGGSSTYGGKVVEKPVIGDEIKKTDAEDIRKVNRLMFATEDVAVFLFYIFSMIIIWVTGVTFK